MERRQVVSADVLAVDQHRALGRVVEPGDQFDQRRLARTGRAHQRHGLAGPHTQRDVAQRVLLGAGVAERHRPQLDAAFEPFRHGGRLGRRGHRRAGTQQIPDPLQPHLGLLVAVENPGQLLHGREEQAEVEQERDQHPGGQAARRHAPRADAQHRGLCDLRQQGYEREVSGDVALGAQPRPPVCVAALREHLRGVPFTAVCLRHPHPGNVLLQVGVDRAHPLARFGVGGRRHLAEDRCGHQQGR